jgi:hypothetical protein
MAARLLVCGSRSITDPADTKKAIDEALASWGLTVHDIELLVSGGARGVDKSSELWASENGVPTQIFPADWNLHGRSAGLLRNLEMLDYVGKSGPASACVVGVWDGESTGTQHTLRHASSRGFRVFVKKVSVSHPPKPPEQRLGMLKVTRG